MNYFKTGQLPQGQTSCPSCFSMTWHQQQYEPRYLGRRAPELSAGCTHESRWKGKPIYNTVKRQVFYKCAAVQQSRKSTTGLMTPSYIEFCLRPTSDLEHKQHLWLCFLFVKSGTELHQRSLYWEP